MRWVLLLFLIWNCNQFSPIERKTVANAEFSLEETEDLGTISLEGEWRRYSGFDTSRPSTLVKFPDLWTKGCYTYEMDIQLQEKTRSYLLIFPEQRTNFRVLWNGWEKAKAGNPSCEESESIPSGVTKSFTIIGSGKNTLQIQISNFHHAEGGFVQPILIGDSGVTQSIVFSKVTLEIVLTGAIFAFGIFHFILHAYRRKESAALFFGFVCILSAARFMITGNKAILTFFPNFPWEWMVRLDFGFSFLIALSFLLFIDGLFVGFLSLTILKFLSGITLTLFLLALIVDPFYFTQVELVFQVIGILLGFLLLVRVYYLFRKGIPESGLFFMGCLVLYAGFLIDIAFAIGNFLGISILQANLFFFFGFQSVILTLRSVRFFEKRVHLKSDFESSIKELEQTITFFERFIPTEFIKQLNKNSIEDASLGDGNQREMAILFADIVGYWDLMYSIPFEERIEFTNQYFGKFSPIVSKNGGFVDKYIGGNIMALFDGSITNAVQAAVDMQKMAISFNEGLMSKGKMPIKIGIGIHFGDTFLGIIGEEKRLESTVISDGVNLASRLQGLTAGYAASILVTLPSLMMHEELDSLSYRILDFVRVKGKSETVMIAEILIPGIDSSADAKIEHKDMFESALFDYERADFGEALSKFETVHQANPEDHAASLYTERCKYFLHKEVGEDWDGVYEWEKS